MLNKLKWNLISLVVLSSLPSSIFGIYYYYMHSPTTSMYTEALSYYESNDILSSRALVDTILASSPYHRQTMLLDRQLSLEESVRQAIIEADLILLDARSYVEDGDYVTAAFLYDSAYDVYDVLRHDSTPSQIALVHSQQELLVSEFNLIDSDLSRDFLISAQAIAGSDPMEAYYYLDSIDVTTEGIEIYKSLLAYDIAHSRLRQLSVYESIDSSSSGVSVRDTSFLKSEISMWLGRVGVDSRYYDVAQLELQGL